MQIGTTQPFRRAVWLLHFRIENVDICIPNCTSQNDLCQNNQRCVQRLRTFITVVFRMVNENNSIV